MDKFVTIVKPSTARTLAATAGDSSGGGKQPKQKPRPAYRYNPYTDAEANKRQPGDWKEKRRVEKWVIHFAKFYSAAVWLTAAWMQPACASREERGQAHAFSANEAFAQHSRGRIQPNHSL